MATLRLHIDPGHAWLEVPAPIIDALGFKPQDFTKFSYISSSGTLYLEEDCDMPKFVKEFTTRFGAPQFEERMYTQHAPCKSLARNSAGAWKPFA